LVLKKEANMEIAKAIESMKLYFGKDEKRINHALSVLLYSETILKEESITDDFIKQVVTYTAIFHDIGIPEAERKYNSSVAIYQEQEGPIVARIILNELGVRQDILERTCYIIGHHHTQKAIDDRAFQVIWEADFIVNVIEGWIRVDRNKKEEIISKNFKSSSGRKIIEEIV
jgi:HD superfamily phosphodiesterase